MLPFMKKYFLDLAISNTANYIVDNNNHMNALNLNLVWVYYLFVIRLIVSRRNYDSCECYVIVHISNVTSIN